MSTEQQTAELVEKPDEAANAISVPEEWSKHFEPINKTLGEMEQWKLMTIAKDGITKVTANRVAAKKLRVRIEELRKELGRTIMLRKQNVDAFADRLKDAVTAVETALEVIETAHKEKVRAEREEREREAAKILNERIAQLESVGYIPADVAALATMTQQQFQQLFDNRRAIFEAAEILRTRIAEIRAIGPDNISEAAVSMMTAAEFSTYLNCHRVACEAAERERAEAEQAERDRVAKLEAELEESRQRVRDLESRSAVVDSSPEIGEVIDAEFDVIEPGQSAVIPAGHDITPISDAVEITLLLRADDSALYAYAENLNMSAEATKLLMAQRSFQSVWSLDRKTGVLTLKSFDGHNIDRPF